MFKDLSEGTTNWYCPKCGGVCSSGIDHICPLDEKVALTEKGLVEIKKPKHVHIKKAPPKMILCHNCGSGIEEFDNREICYWCRTKYWKKPTLRQRISAAIKGFRLGK